MNFLNAIGLLLFAWAATLSGVLAGGWLVFKAGQGGSLFTLRSGGAYNLDDDAEEVEREPRLPPEIETHVNRFRQTYDPGEAMFGGSATRHGAAQPFAAPVPPKGDDDEGN
jgi:hypothetical protein